MLKVDENVNIKDYCTLKVGGQFRYFSRVASVKDLEDAIEFAREHNVKTFVLGGGSNIVFSDSVLDVLALKIELLGFEVVNDTSEYIDIKIGAGVEWDSVVERTVNMNLSGIEALSAIPGTTGATPVQNVGAYGTEIKNTLIEVEVYDIESSTVKKLSNSECKFTYRDSIFKNEARGKYIILSVTLRLLKSKPTVPDYPGVKKYFDDMGITEPTLLQIREAIISIRGVKLPDPRKIANVGSFFKNPIVLNSVAEKIKESYPNATFFKVDDSHTKIPAGWLIENTGLKDADFGEVCTYKHNALVLVNKGSATTGDIFSARDEIIEKVYSKFGIHLEQEPEIV